MHKFHSSAGQSLMEILFAMTIFLVGVVTVNYLVFDAQSALQKNTDFTVAYLLAEEGIEAMRTIRDHSFSDVETGTYGLEFNDLLWTVSEQPTDVTSKYSRSITVVDIDSHLKKIVSLVVWTDEQSTQKQVKLVTYLSNWRGSSGDAASLAVDTSNAYIGTSTNELAGVTLENTGVNPITITGIKVQYENVYVLHEIHINGIPVYLVPMELGSNSGDMIDIEDYTVPPSSGEHLLEPILFNGAMTGTDFLITFRFSDESVKDVRINF